MSNSAPVVVLVGLPGAGKSTVGRLLADRLGASFRDIDADIEATAGKVISEIFVDEGETAFREMEAAAIAAALTAHDGVLALGGGAVLNATTRGLLARHHVIYLRVDLADAIKRVGLSQHRPVLALNPRATLRQLEEERRPLYQEVAVHTVDTSRRAPEEIVDDVVLLIKEGPA